MAPQNIPNAIVLTPGNRGVLYCIQLDKIRQNCTLCVYWYGIKHWPNSILCPVSRHSAGIQSVIQCAACLWRVNLHDGWSPQWFTSLIRGMLDSLGSIYLTLFMPGNFSSGCSSSQEWPRRDRTDLGKCTHQSDETQRNNSTQALSTNLVF